MKFEERKKQFSAWLRRLWGALRENFRHFWHRFQLTRWLIVIFLSAFLLLSIYLTIIAKTANVKSLQSRLEHPTMVYDQNGNSAGSRASAPQPAGSEKPRPRHQAPRGACARPHASTRSGRQARCLLPETPTRTGRSPPLPMCRGAPEPHRPASAEASSTGRLPQPAAAHRPAYCPRWSFSSLRILPPND